MSWSEKKLRGIILPLLLILAAASLTGCGYRHPKAALGDGKSGAVRLYSPIWKNQTSQIGFEAEMHHDLVSWFQQNGDIAIANTRDEAEFQLDGEIAEIASPGLTYGSFNQARELRATLTVSYRLTSRQDGALVWETARVTMEEPYPVGDNAIRTRDNRRKALGRISNRLAEEIYLKVLGYRPHDRREQ